MKLSKLFEALAHDTDRNVRQTQYDATLSLIIDLRNGKTPVSPEQHAQMMADLNAEIYNNNSGRIGFCLAEAQEVYQHEVRALCGCDTAEQIRSIA